MSQTVVIIGAGSFGAISALRLAKSTPDSVKIVLINPTEYSVMLPGTVRLMFHKDPSKISVPIMRTLGSHISSGKVEFVMDTVVHFDDSVVVVKSGSQYKYDVLVLATGAKWPSPIDPSAYIGATQAGIREGIEKVVEKFDSAKRVAIVGGGDIGVELLGEFLHYSPGKEYYLIHNRELLLTSRYIEKVRETAHEQLEELALGSMVKFYFDSYAHRKSQTELEIKNNKTGDTESLEVDLIYETVGPGANVPPTSIDKNLLLDDGGYIKIKEGFQTEYSQRIFAIGDVSNLPLKGLVIKDDWIASLVNNVRHVLGLAKNYDGYNLPPLENIPVAVSIGPTGGTGQMKLPILGVCRLPRFVVVRAKSATLNAQKYQSIVPS